MKEIAYAICIVGLCAISGYCEVTGGTGLIYFFFAVGIFSNTNFVNARISVRSPKLAKQKIAIDGDIFHLIEAHRERSTWSGGEKVRLTLWRDVA